MDYIKSPCNFLELPDDCSSYSKSQAVILPIPYEKTTSYLKGAKKGPDAVIKASVQIESYDDELGNAFEAGICTLKPLEIGAKPEFMVHEVARNVKTLLDDGKFIAILGGEHSITSGAVSAFKEKFKDLSVLQIDAHADLREEYQGSRHSHACAMKRVLDICPVVPVGIRSISSEEAEFAGKSKYRIFWAKDIVGNDKWLGDAVSLLSKNVYITFDLDGLDPGIMPSVGTPEPGGLSYYETLRFLRKVFQERNVVGFDIVELCPKKYDVSSDVAAARILYKMIGYKFMKKGNRKLLKQK